MKKLTILKIAIASLISMAILACQKTNNTSSESSVNHITNSNADQIKSFDVIYFISPVSNCATRITYTDGSGNSVTVSDTAVFRNGIIRISVLAKSFIARIAVEVNNTTDAPIPFHLGILVDEEIKKSVDATAPPMTPSTKAFASCTVNGL
jgi:hypothetical protein